MLKTDAQKVPEHTEAKWDGVINHTITISTILNTENFYAFKTLRINRSRP